MVPEQKEIKKMDLTSI